MDRRAKTAAGFSLVEILIVIAIIGIISNIAIPVVQQQLWRARATTVIADFHVFQQAATEYYRDHGEFPPNATQNRPAHEFDPYIAGRFRWSHPRPNVICYIWENWAEKAHGRNLDIKYGLSVKIPDERLVAAVSKLYDGRFEQTVYQKYTFVMAGYD